jgi:hypothetical protein
MHTGTRINIERETQTKTFEKETAKEMPDQKQKENLAQTTNNEKITKISGK